MTVQTSRPRRIALAAPALLLALALSACGDDGEGDGGGAGNGDGGAEETSAISKDEFVEQANGVCADGNKQLETEGEKVDPTDPDAIPRFATEVLVPNVRGQLDAIRDLGFPEGDEELLGGVLDDASAALDVIEGDPMVLATGPNPFDEVNVALNDYGLTECGSE